jgi:hypothetical protein
MNYQYMTRTNAGIKAGKVGELSGGQDGDIPYQFGTDSTEFAHGTGLVYSNGFGAPVISNTVSGIVSFPNSTIGKSSNLAGGVSGQIPYQSAVNTTSFASGPGLVYANASGAPTISNTISATMSLTNTTVAKSNNLVGSTTNTIPYQSATDTTSFLPTTAGLLTRFVNNGLPVFQDITTFVPTIQKFGAGGSSLTSFAYTVQEGFRQRVNGCDIIMIRIQGTPTLTGGGMPFQISCDITFNRNFFMDGLEFTANSFPGILLNGRGAPASNIINVYTSNLGNYNLVSGTAVGLMFTISGYGLVV